jgi:hypothetical protein
VGGADLSGDSVCHHRDERVVKEGSRGLTRVQGRVAVEEGAPQRHTEAGTGHCVGFGGNNVKYKQ